MLYLEIMFNPDHIKKNFTIFRHFPELIFVDNASTTQKPQVVIEAIKESYEKYNANIHRAVYDLGIHADENFKNTKKAILQYYNLEQLNYEIVFTAGTTDGINKIARGLEQEISEGDNIVVSEMEHHSNFLPWQELCIRRNATLRIIPITDSGELDLTCIDELIDDKTKIVSIVHISNTLGTINDIQKISKSAKNVSAHFFIDAAQSAALYKDSFANINATAIVFSGHKIFGPSGIGVIIGKSSFFSDLYPFNYGGGMVLEANKNMSIYKKDISKHEAGTPPLAQIAGLLETFHYLSAIDHKAAQNHLKQLAKIFRAKMNGLGIKCMGSPKEFSGIVSVDFGTIHPHDVATYLNSKNIAVRAGHHCTQLIMKKYDIPASVRFSFSIYNTEKDVEQIIQAIHEMRKYFA